MLQCPAVYRCREKQSLEENFPHHNWIHILTLQLILSTSWSVMTPSIYQYITTPRSILEEDWEATNYENTSRLWPGLGGSDIDYAWALVCSPISELALVPFAALMAHRTPYTVVILFGLLVMALGGIIYAIAVNVWMVCIGRGLLGAAGSICIPTLHTYIGEMGIVMDDLRKKQRKRPRKFILYIAFSFMMNGGFVVSFALTSIMAQFQDVNPYRWPGWFIAVQSFAFAAATLFFFTETRSFTCHKDSFFKYFAGLKLSVQLGSKCNLQLSYIFMIACGFMIGQVYAVLFTLVTPVLSDQFGFNVECTSHFFVGVSAAFCASSVIQLGAKISRVDNRIILGLCLIFALVGSILVGDWQSIGHDPCSSASLDTASEMHCNGTYSLNSSCYTQLVENCEALSSSGHECFWNPQSEVTGEFCNTCLPVCLGKQKSLNIYQFSLGVLLLALSTLGFVFTSAITSEITAVESQGVSLALAMGSGTLGRAVAPYWLVESYELTGRHTYLAMAIIAGCALVLLLSLAALYKKLAPKSNFILPAAVNATSSQVAATELESTDSDALQSISHPAVE